MCCFIVLVVTGAGLAAVAGDKGNALGKGKLKGRGCVVANLQQNPAARPVVSALLPTLLRNGCMWCIRFRDDGTIKDLPSSEQLPRLRGPNEVPEERYMLGKDS